MMDMTQDKALSILKTGANVFLTGEPGSGKTHTINSFVTYLREHDIEPAITASTGIAATHIGGMTIHSWSGIGIKTRLDKYDLDRIASSEHIAKRIRRAKILIVDEISMLPPNTLSMVDSVCREVKQNTEAFGGLQVVFVGDFFQLPPIMKGQPTEQAGPEYDDPQMVLYDDDEVKIQKFAYDSSAWTRAKPIVCYLSEQYRQDDTVFLSILSAIRANIFEEGHLTSIKTRKIEIANAPKDIPKLYSHNLDVDRVNTHTLGVLKGEERNFEMSSQGRDNLVATLKKGCLSPETLTLKIGASVMFTKNNIKEGFVNGTLGEVTGFDQSDGWPIVRTRRGLSIKVEPMDWTVEENGKIRAQINQVPLRLAWAITVHKSQGMSLDAAVMDLSDVFEFGQGYVALSRVRRLSGLHILGWNARAFQVHPEVLEKDIAFHVASDEAETAFENISKTELDKMHSNFLVAMGGTIAKIIPKKKTKLTKINTREETLALVMAGKSLSDIAKERGLKEGTIIQHVEELIEKKAITLSDCSHLASPALKKSLPKINTAFKKLGTDRLAPIFEHFKGAYSYDHLRLARLLLNK
jgi:ATP-dependent exoDNAse (exonuclease V) alpha subunit/DNA-binding CsgD family transcriptional regulator